MTLIHIKSVNQCISIEHQKIDMNRISIYFFALFVSFTSFHLQAQNERLNNSSSKALSKQDKDAIQIKSYEGSYTDILRSIVATLNALDYEGIKTDSTLGLITASLPEEDISDSTASRTASAVVSVFTLGIVGNDDQVKYRNRGVTFLVTSLSSTTSRVKITLKETVTTNTENWVSSSKNVVSDLTDNPKIYQEIFDEVTKQLNILKK